MNEEINLLDYVNTILKHWKIIILIALVTTIFAFVTTKREQPLYQSKTTMLVRLGGGSINSKLAGLAGIKVSSGPADDFIEVLQSRAVALKVLTDLKLRESIAGWDDPKIDDHILASSVAGMLKPPKQSGNLLELTVVHTDPKLTAKIVNAFIDSLSFYLNKLNYTEAKKQREYIEKQLPRVEENLMQVEQKLKDYTLLSGASSSKSPAAGITVMRLNREFEILNEVYVMLRQEYESVKLEESKEIDPFTILDEAHVPKSPFKPNVRLNVLIGLILGLFFGVFIAFMWEYWQNLLDKQKERV
ncbi:MAG: hypothetical protein HQ564_03440 [Candidatus Saganbacteria bacterium]|nr:hypothetical protein [Candidatus Saganbacteria bacterium]